MRTSSRACYVPFMPFWWPSMSTSTTCCLMLRTNESMQKGSSAFYLWLNPANSRLTLSRRLSSKTSRMSETKEIELILGNGLFILWMIMLSWSFTLCSPSILFTTSRTSRRPLPSITDFWGTVIQNRENNCLTRCEALLRHSLSFVISFSVKLASKPIGVHREALDLSCKELID